MESPASAYCEKWKLSKPSLLVSTFTSEIYKVKFRGIDAILKILNDKGKQFEAKGAAVLRCFDGAGAVRLLDADDGAHLLEFIDGQPLKDVVLRGDDVRATEIVCEIVQKLHGYPGPVPSELISMERNFRALFLKGLSRSQEKESEVCGFR